MDLTFKIQNSRNSYTLFAFRSDDNKKEYGDSGDPDLEF
jgi:hypothetical protein